MRGIDVDNEGGGDETGVNDEVARLRRLYPLPGETYSLLLSSKLINSSARAEGTRGLPRPPRKSSSLGPFESREKTRR